MLSSIIQQAVAVILNLNEKIKVIQLLTILKQQKGRTKKEI